MIDVHAAVVAIHNSNLTGGQQAAIRATTEVLADCWDDCIDSKPGDPIRDANPYRLALELTPNGPSAPAGDEPEPNQRYAGWLDVDVTEGKSNPERDDPELNAMRIIVQALDGLDDPTQHRIIRYVSERIA